MERQKPYKLDEASLARAYQHVVEKKVPSWGMLTAYRYANTKKENIQANKMLEKDLRSKGYGFFKVEGHWQECQDSNLNYVECPEDKLQDSIEVSLFVPGMKKRDIELLCKKYNQDAVIYGGEENIGQFEPGKVSQAYSKLKGGKSFVFQAKKKEEPAKFEPDEPKKDNMKLKSLLPKGILDKTVKNPDTGKMIKIKSALKYDDTHMVKQAAKNMIKTALKK